MKALKELEAEVKSLKSQVKRLKEEFQQLHITRQEAARSDLKVGDSVIYHHTQERGKVHVKTKCRVGVLFNSGKIRYYKEKNLTKVE
jgi:hypothetical protein